MRSTQDQIQKRLEFLQTQIDSLDHYLPETYQFLMAELDAQQRDLMALKIQDFYSQQTDELNNQIPDTGHPKETSITRDRTEGVCD